MIRDDGAKEVHFHVAAPPVISHCFYGMDFPSREELFANQFDSVDDMASWLGVDSLSYLSIDGLEKAVASANESPLGSCNACFSGNYPVPVDMSGSKEENEW